MSKKSTDQITELPDVKMNLRKRNEKSARTSFALVQEAHDSLAWLSEKLGTPKDVFQMITNNIMVNEIFGIDYMGILKDRRNRAENAEVVRRSFVISERSLKELNRFSKEANEKRDILVEKLLIWFKIITEHQTKELLEKQRKVQALFNQFMDIQVGELESKMGELLDRDDPIIDAISQNLHFLKMIQSDIYRGLEDDEPITEEIDI